MALVPFDPALDLPEPALAHPDYEADPYVERSASPPDGVNQDWTEVHPNGSKAVLTKGV